MAKKCQCVHVQIRNELTEYGTLKRFEYQHQPPSVLPSYTWISPEELYWDFPQIRDQRKRKAKKQKLLRSAIIIIEIFMFLWIFCLFLSLFTIHDKGNKNSNV